MCSVPHCPVGRTGKIHIYLADLAWNSVAQRDNSHVRIEALGGSEESRRKTMLRIAADVIWLAFCLLLVKYGFELVASIYTRGLISAAMRMPMYLVYLSLPVSQLAVSLRIIGELWRTVKEYRNGAAEPWKEAGKLEYSCIIWFFYPDDGIVGACRICNWYCNIYYA